MAYVFKKGLCAGCGAPPPYRCAFPAVKHTSSSASSVALLISWIRCVGSRKDAIICRAGGILDQGQETLVYIDGLPVAACHRASSPPLLQGPLDEYCWHTRLSLWAHQKHWSQSHPGQTLWRGSPIIRRHGSFSFSLSDNKWHISLS